MDNYITILPLINTLLTFLKMLYSAFYKKQKSFYSQNIYLTLPQLTVVNTQENHDCHKHLACNLLLKGGKRPLFPPLSIIIVKVYTKIFHLVKYWLKTFI